MYAVMHGRTAKTVALLGLLLVLLSCMAAESAFAVSEVSVRSAPLSTQNAPVNGMVRVYLSSLGSPQKLDLTVQGQYVLGSSSEILANGTRATVVMNPSNGQLSITVNGRIMNMGQSFSLRRIGTGTSNGIKISQARESNNPYPGDLSFKAVLSAGAYKLYTIAHIYIENYLYGVLPYEMGNSSSLEALKAQAVAARTYTVRMMQLRASGMYDVQDTTNDQTYRGTPAGNANCVAAIDATKGIVLMYGSSYVTTYYSASNGGQTEIARTGSSLPYMKVKDDPFDYANPSSTLKKKTIYTNLGSSSNSAQLISLLKTKTVTALQQNGYAATYDNTILGNLLTLTPHTPKYASPSRLYTKMDFTFGLSTQSRAGYTVSLTQTVTCDIFNELESILGLNIQSTSNELWSVVQTSAGIEIQARRYGHGMGMSQRGAMYMAKLGYTYDQILGFYYEDCTRVRKSFTSSVLTNDGDEHVSVETPVEDEGVDPSACYGTVRLSSPSATLAVRSSKSSDSQMIAALANGAKVEVLANRDGWSFIRFGEIYGFVPSGSITIVGTPSGTEGAATNVLGFATVTATDYVNLRAGQSTATKALGTAPSGAILSVFSTNGGWAHVQYNTLAAFVSTQYISAVTSQYPSGNVTSGSNVAFITTQDGGSVNLRASASTSAQVLMQLPCNTEVTVVADDGSWAHVQASGITGYVMSIYLCSNEQEVLPDISVPSAPEGTKALVATESGSLNMRSQPFVGSQIITTIPRNAEVIVTDSLDQWTAIFYNGRNGYVMSSFLRYENTDETPAPASDSAVVITPGGGLNLRTQPWTGSSILLSIPQGETVSLLEYGSQWSQVSWQNMTGYVMTSFLSFESREDGAGNNETVPQPGLTHDWATVHTPSGALNLRAQPSAFAQVLLQIPRNARVQVEWAEKEWSMIHYSSYTGYVMTKYLSFASAPVPDENPSSTPLQQIAYVATSSGALNMRSHPSATAEVIKLIPQFAPVTVMSYGDVWSSIVYETTGGYVMSRYLSFDKPSPAPDNSTEYPKPVWVNTASGSLNMRSMASQYAQVLTSIPKGERIMLLASEGEWGCVEYAGIQGYVMMRYLTDDEKLLYHYEESTSFMQHPEFDLTLQSPSEAMFALSQRTLLLWQECSENSIVIGTVPAESEVEIVLVGQTWCCVQYQNIQGYCRTNLLSVIQK